MNTVIVDASLRTKLGNLRETTMFTDENGRVLGHFRPAAPDARREPRINEEEIQRRLQQGGGRTLAEIMADLEKRA